MYYNYHAQIKKLIKENKLIESWNNISPALVLFFSNHRPMPIRKNKWHEYEKLLNIKINP